ncbi:MAG: carboxypeptidase regulatory-like domain-containing protein [Bryobacteraceae bacterium]
MTARELVLLSALALWSAALLGQEGRGTIAGRVLDASGAVVAGSEVRAVNAGTGAAARTRTNESGAYTLPYLAPGTYTVTAEMAGFKTTERPGIEVRINDVLSLELVLQVGAASEKIEVVATTPLLESTTVSVGQVVDGRRLLELPMQGNNPFELVMLAPGVVNTTNLRAKKSSFGNASSQFRTNGGRQYSNEFTIDGVPNTFSAGDNPEVAFQPPRAAVSEFKVQTTAFDASLGHTAGAVVNLITKSGTNQFHGEMHEWFSHSALDAATFFQNRAGEKKPVYQDNLYGASLGGPVRLPRLYDGRNRTFFFYAWESNQWVKPMPRVGTVPTAAEKNGDLSALLALGSSYQIYDPFTTRAAERGRMSRQPLAGNIVPASRIDPVARKIMAFYREPNTPGTRDGRDNFTHTNKDAQDYTVHFARVDHNFSERNRLFLRLNWDKRTETKEQFYENIAMGLNNVRANRGLALDDVVVLSPSSVLNLRYGLSRTEAPKARVSSGKIDLATLGFSPALTSLIDPQRASFPMVYLNTRATNSPCKGNCTGTFSGFGAPESGEGHSSGLIHNFAANLTTLRGRHNLRYGGDFRAYRAFNAPLGYDVAPGLQFLPTYTRGPLDNSPMAPIGQEFAAFLLGIPEGQMNRSASFATQDMFTGLFLQDDWKLTSKLTINLGLRYEYETPMTERFNRAVRGFDQTAANPIEAQARAAYTKNPIAEIPVDQFRVRGGLTFAGPDNRGLWQGEKNNLLPRIGFAYQWNAATVVRSGYGLFFDTLGVNRTLPSQPGFTAVTPIIPSYDNGLTFSATTANPFPNGLMAPVGAAAGLATNLGQDMAVFPLRRLHPYSQQWTFGIQRVLPAGFLLDTAYAGNKGIRFEVDRSINRNALLSRSGERDQALIDYLSQQIPNPFYGLGPVFTKTISRSDLLKPFPQFGSIDESEPIGYTWYHSLLVRGEKRFSRGYTVNAAYTWSKSMEATSFLNSVDTALYRSISRYDRPHRFVVNGIVELPFGRGRAIASGIPGALDHIIGGWQANAVMTKQSGPPLAFGDVIFRGSIKDIPLPASQRTVERWFNTSGFERRPSQQLEYNVRTFPRYLSGVRADGQSKWDLSLTKHFRMSERINLQFRAECYNCTNHTNFNEPNMTVTSTSFGTITDQSGLSRQFQLALKLTY